MNLAVTDSQASVAEDQQQMLTFTVGEQSYGIDILSVQEIRGWEGATRIPGAPQHLQGVVNLRGMIVPVVDLRQRLGEPDRQVGVAPVMIVVLEQGAAQQQMFGLVVDGVSDVQDVTTADWRSLPANMEQHQGHVAGLVCVDEQMIVVLNVRALMESPQAARKGNLN